MLYLKLTSPLNAKFNIYFPVESEYEHFKFLIEGASFNNVCIGSVTYSIVESVAFKSKLFTPLDTFAVYSKVSLVLFENISLYSSSFIFKYMSTFSVASDIVNDILIVLFVRSVLTIFALLIFIISPLINKALPL